MEIVELSHCARALHLFRDSGHRLAFMTMKSGEALDCEALRQHERTDGEVWTAQGEKGAVTKFMLLSGVGMFHTETAAFPVLPEFGDARFGLFGFDIDYFEAITDVEIACFSPMSNEAFQMFKVEAQKADAPVQLSSADGMYVCMISGTAAIDGIAFSAGGRFDLSDETVTLTPVGGDCQYVLIKDRNAESVAVEGVPRSVSPRQIRQALNQTGQRDAVEAAVAAGDQDLKDWWEFSTLIERNNSHVIGMGAALNQAPDQLDALFSLASTL